MLRRTGKYKYISDAEIVVGTEKRITGCLFISLSHSFHFLTYETTEMLQHQISIELEIALIKK